MASSNYLRILSQNDYVHALTSLRLLDLIPDDVGASKSKTLDRDWISPCLQISARVANHFGPSRAVWHGHHEN